MKKMSYALLPFVLLMSSAQLQAAVSKNLVVESALRQPLNERISHLKKQGLRGKHELQKIAFNESADLQTRWRAVTAMGRIYKNDAADFLDKALMSREWFMRNAALIVAPHVGRAWAISRAKKMLDDQALVVRTAAVQVLNELEATETADLLWEKLYSQENYRGRYSLWVRRHILETLAKFAKPGQEAGFVIVLGDRDESLHPVAMRTLERLSSEKFNTKSQWQAWWKNRRRI